MSKKPGYNREYYDKTAFETLNHYGGVCACCGFSDFSKKVRGRRWLQLDHVQGGGAVQRKSVGQNNLLWWTRANGYPPGFRVLCIVCNIAMEPGEGTCEFHKMSNP